MRLADVLQVLVVSAAVGIAALKVGAPAEPFLAVVRAALAVVQKVVWWIIRLAPLGTLGLIGRAVFEYGWTSIRNTWGSTNPKNVKGYAYNALIGLAKLRLAEIAPFSWADPSWGLSTGSFAHAVAKITHHR